MDRIRQLLEIIERERHHKLLLSIKNLQDLGPSPFPYIVLVLPRPLPSEVVKGEHFVLVDLLKSLLGGRSRAPCPAKLSTLAMQNPKLAPQAMTKKKKKSGQAKAAGEGLEGFVDWTNPAVSQSAKERETKMSSLVIGFTMWMHKRAANAQKGTTLGLEVLGDKCFRPSRFDEEVQADPIVIVADSLERVLEAPSAIGGGAQDASRKACVALEDEIPVREFPYVDDAFIEATNAPSPRASFTVDGTRRLFDRLVNNS